ncbi:MAG: hypothetical protein CMH52_01055 [Myxococcales bacterium]|nr:hypothetical protein [Myxococcales bacterium]
MSQSDDGRKNGSADMSDWAAINTVQPTEIKQGDASTSTVKAQTYSIPQDVQSIDFKPTGYRSYTGLLVLGAVVLVGGGLYYGYEMYPTTALENQKPVLLSSTQKLDRPVDTKSRQVIERTIEFTSQPPGARVILNGNPLPEVTPTQAKVSSDIGGQVRFSLSGYADTFASFRDSETKIDGILKQTEHKALELQVESRPLGARIFIDGIALGESPLKTKIERHAQVALKLEAKGHYPHVIIVPIGDRDALNIGETLLAGVTPRTQGNISVVTQPENAMIERKNLEGLWLKAGRSGFEGIKLVQNIGMPISFRASADGYETKVFTLDVDAPFYTVNLVLNELKVERGDLQLNGAKTLMVFLDSEELDALPQLAKQRKAGLHNIVVVDPKTRKRLKTKVAVIANQMTTYQLSSDESGITLQQEPDGR